MAIAFEDISALIVVANGRADASEATALMKALVVAVRNLHALMYEFHKWFMSSGPSEHAAAERSLWDAHLQRRTPTDR
jgi:hypothetical protein